VAKKTEMEMVTKSEDGDGHIINNPEMVESDDDHIIIMIWRVVMNT
jgi:hypothetical protein